MAIVERPPPSLSFELTPESALPSDPIAGTLPPWRRLAHRRIRFQDVCQPSCTPSAGTHRRCFVPPNSRIRQRTPSPPSVRLRHGWAPYLTQRRGYPITSGSTAFASTRPLFVFGELPFR